MKTARIAWLFFLAMTMWYFSLSPGTIAGMGYMGENLKASHQIVSNLLTWLTLKPAATPIDRPRHGFLELAFEVPFLVLGRPFFGAQLDWADRILAIQPILVTSLLCTLIFVWIRRITGSLLWGYVLAIGAGTSTLLWPYAYIGLETTQSLFLMLSAYLAFESGDRKSWPRTILFALSCAVAVGVKANGFLLVPAVGFLIFCYFRRELSKYAGASKSKAIAVVSIIAALLAVNSYGRSSFFASPAGFVQRFAWELVDSPLTFALNAFSFFGSPNKGLLLYSPIVILCLAALPKAYSVHPRLVIFTLLVLAGLVAGFSPIVIWADETWGPRYLHSAIGPLIICFALTRKSTQFRLRRELPLLALVGLGTIISLLGSLFYYGSLHIAAIQTSQNTIEALQYDIRWNHLRFNLKLLQVWLHTRTTPAGISEVWPPPQHWWFKRPPDALPPKSVNLDKFAVPQPTLIRTWTMLNKSPHKSMFWVYLASFAFGASLLIWLGRVVMKLQAAESPP